MKNPAVFVERKQRATAQFVIDFSVKYATESIAVKLKQPQTMML